MMNGQGFCCSHLSRLRSGLVASLATLGVAAFAVPAHAELDSKSDATSRDFDGGPASSTVTFVAGDFTGTGVVTGVTVDVTVRASDDGFGDINEWDELSATLTSPGGTALPLLNDASFIFTLGIVAPLNWTFADTGIATGGSPADLTTYAPDGSLPVPNLAAFNGESAFAGTGVWTLTFSDSSVSANPANLSNFTLNLTTADAVPEPGSVALFGVGAIGLLGVRARRRRRHCAKRVA